MRPVETLLQNTILVLLLRTVLGGRGYRWFEKVKALVSSRTRRRLTTEAIHVGTNS
jgi:hypothetical protein